MTTFELNMAATKKNIEMTVEILNKIKKAVK